MLFCFVLVILIIVVVVVVVVAVYVPLLQQRWLPSKVDNVIDSERTWWWWWWSLSRWGCKLLQLSTASMINSRLYEESFPFVLPLSPSLPSATVFPLYFLCDLTLDLFYTRLTLMCVDFAGGQQAVDGGAGHPIKALNFTLLWGYTTLKYILVHWKKLNSCNL